MKENSTQASGAAVIGPYSRAVEAGGLVFTSGQLPIDPLSGDIAAGGIEQQTVSAIENLKAVLEGAGVSLRDVVKTTVFLRDMDDFAAVNAVYAQRFHAPYPARSCVEAARLPRDARIEIEAVAARR